LRSLILIVFVLFSTFASAVEVHGLYQVEIPVPDQTRDSRQVAYREALQQILVRVSGQSQVMMQRQFHEVLDDAWKLVQSFRYRQLDVQEAQDKGLEHASLVLVVNLDPEQVRRLLREAERPIWGQVRPNTVTWVVVEQGGKRELLGAASSHPAKQIMERRAELRGLPLQFPLLDLTDQQVVSVSDVWGGFAEPIKTASLRYSDDAVFFGRVYSRGRLWYGEWHLLVHGHESHWRLEGTDLATVLQPSVDIAVDSIARRYAQSTSEGESVGYTRVKVWNVQSLSDYSAVIKYLEKQISVVNVIPETVDGNSVVFRIRTEGKWANVAKAISLGNLLYPYTPDVSAQPTSNGSTDAVANSTPLIHYRYLP
jgi:hypothetical protein